MNNNLLESFKPYRDKVQATLKDIVAGHPSSLNPMLRYHMGWQDENGNPRREEAGKFIRPILCLLSCQATRGDISRILPAAAALELIHNFSLIHDDIQDDSYERHHQPTVWSLWGRSQAINVGDAMFTLVYLALIKLRDNGIPYEIIVGCTNMISTACLELCEGQYLDIEYETRLDVTVQDYLDMVVGKTAALIAVSTAMGAYLGSENGKVINAFRLFGKELGMAFQIDDDILGIWGTKESTGKPANDISQKKKTLPVVYALQHSNGEERKKLEELYLQESIKDNDIAQVMEILNNLSARDYAQNLAAQYYYQALAQLEATGLDKSRQAPLRKIACFLLGRDY